MAGGRSVKAPVSAEVSTLHLVPCAKHFSSNCWTPSRSFLPVTLLSSSLLYLSSALSPSQQIYIICCLSSTLSPNFSFFPTLFFRFASPSNSLPQPFVRNVFSWHFLSFRSVLGVGCLGRSYAFCSESGTGLQCRKHLPDRMDSRLVWTVEGDEHPTHDR